MSTTPNLAQQALEVYDQHGETAMLQSLAENQDTRPAGDGSASPALQVLKDHTAVQSTDLLYNFLGIEDEDGRCVDRLRTRLRFPQTRDLGPRPDPPHSSSGPTPMASGT